MSFTALAHWLYPAALNGHTTTSDNANLQQLISITRTLLRSGREEGFYLAVKCINENRQDYSFSAIEQDFLQDYPEAAQRPTAICDALLANPVMHQIEAGLVQLNKEETTQIRNRLNNVLDYCLPTILWIALCDLKTYKKEADMRAHINMARLLYLHGLVFEPEYHSLIASAQLGEFIQLINPLQSVEKLHVTQVSKEPYRRTIEARRVVLQKASQANGLKED